MRGLEFDRPLQSRSPEETEILAAKFYSLITPSAVVALYGPLGAGKTGFVRGVAIAAGIARSEVSSPSFTLINEYHGGKTPIYHFDLYRLKEPSEFYSIGGDDYLTRGGIILIEWAEHGGRFVPEHRYEVHFEIIDETTRQLTFTRKSGC